MGRVIVVGSVNVDLVARVDRLPAAGETVTGAAFSRHHGGKGGNQAVAAARLGVTTAFVGAVGDDDLGTAAREALEAEGIDLRELATVSGPSGVAVIIVDARGENVIAVASGANAALTPNSVRGGLGRLGVGRGDVVLAGCEVPIPAVRAALRAGSEAGATTILNPAPATGIDRSILDLADVVTPNRGEVAELAAHDARRNGRVADAGGRPETAARSLLQPGADGSGVRQAVIVTLGRAGALVAERTGATRDVPATSVDAVDTVGAGDTFSGALAAGLAEGRPLAEAVQRAVAAAGLATTIVGAREGMPTATALEAILIER
ncbi:MAG TPA: ribokinase [Candidatus Limnocylindrales bacterium]